MGAARMVQPPAGRRHDIDAIRVLAFALLIFYHVGMFYVAGWGWHVKSAHLSETLQLLMMLVNQWRLPLLFLISGVAVHFLLRRAGAGEFAWLRTRRLLVPLAFGMVVVVPPQAYYQMLANGAFDSGYAEFLWRYFTFRGWPEGAFDGSQIGITWNHLWYLPYLLFYTLVFALVLPALHSATGQRLVASFRSVRGWQLYLLPALPFVLYAWTLRGRFPETHLFVNDWYAHAVYFTVFMLGYAIGSDAGLWREFQRLRKRSITLAGASYLSLMLVYEFWPDDPNWLHYAGSRALICFNSWFWMMAVLGWSHHLLNRPFHWLPYATEAVYPWYILHQTVTVVLGYELSRLALGPVIEPVLVLGGTLVGCLVIHEYLIRRVPLLRPLFGLKPANAVIGPRADGRARARGRRLRFRRRRGAALY